MSEPRHPDTPLAARRAPALPTRKPGSGPMLPADRSFKVLQPSRTPAQLSLFPPPGLAARHGR